MTNKYQEIMSILKYHNVKMFTKTRGTYILKFVHEFYASYGALLPQGRQQTTTLKLCDSVVVQGKKFNTALILLILFLKSLRKLWMLTVT